MLRIKHTGGETVTKGNYWNFDNGDRISMEKEGVLPGGKNATFYKANPIVILAVGPVLGLAYAAFLPFIGLVIVAKMALTKVFEGTLESMSKVSTFNWSPAAAYLAGRRHKKEGNERKAEADKEKIDTKK